MDIGGGIGGLIVRLDDSLEGTELPIQFAEDPKRDSTPACGAISRWRERRRRRLPGTAQGSYRIHPGKDHTAPISRSSAARSPNSTSAC